MIRSHEAIDDESAAIFSNVEAEQVRGRDGTAGMYLNKGTGVPLVNVPSRSREQQSTLPGAT
jgi:hypothetical protein